MRNPFVHVELGTTEVTKAKAFYSQLFDWKREDMTVATGDYKGVRSQTSSVLVTVGASGGVASSFA